jgi:hypothetical protein
MFCIPRPCPFLLLITAISRSEYEWRNAQLSNVYNSAITDVLRPFVGQKITRVNDEGVDSGGIHRIAVSGYD